MTNPNRPNRLRSSAARFERCLTRGVFPRMYLQSSGCPSLILPTHIASSYVNPRTRIAVIFGNGRNSAYMERVGKIRSMAIRSRIWASTMGREYVKYKIHPDLLSCRLLSSTAAPATRFDTDTPYVEIKLLCQIDNSTFTLLR
jgi:hypothetical protein